MKKLYLIRYGEIGIKGKNRYLFENKLISNIIKALKNEDPEVDVYKTYGRVYVETKIKEDKAIKKLKRIFGIVGIAPARKVDLDVDKIKDTCLEMVHNDLAKEGTTTFKISARRNNKSFELDSMELNRELGAHVLINTEDGRLKVDVHNPEINVKVEIRADFAYIYTKDIAGSGGLPVGVTGKSGLLLSGGIDSPVAGWMIAKRGAKIVPIYFHSFPFTSDRAKEKVIDLAETLATYQGETKLHVVHFTDIQTEMNDKCPEELTTIIMRRIMMKIAERITLNNGGKSLITGESMGQVASQTMESMYVTNMVPEMPIFRPLIGLDKVEIIARAKEIGTYETSIEPYEDCCTVFVPKSPETKPTPKQIAIGEKNLEIEDLIQKAIDEVEVININPYE
ncbi:tRNA uracil 4-sulfurtransferase ThiI [Orenia marismortui]|uniref:Probable tRNA sulfurtransferase n=1 Tax=Orenia marismortui TaxID=46469 RepID=A0A4R8HA78_9FIRM|nr:tRNA uracil 4-sulfurtransferase ThiI [Orenia marismortui]TDX52302.1 thiamine biosynthesis protein ThiI [Orenia marismortui]